MVSVSNTSLGAHSQSNFTFNPFNIASLANPNVANEKSSFGLSLYSTNLLLVHAKLFKYLFKVSSSLFIIALKICSYCK